MQAHASLKRKTKILARSTFKNRKRGKTSRDLLCMRLCSCWKKGLSAAVSPAWECCGTSAAEITLLSMLSGVGNSKVTATRPGTLLMPGTDLEGPFHRTDGRVCCCSPTLGYTPVRDEMSCSESEAKLVLLKKKKKSLKHHRITEWVVLEGP